MFFTTEVCETESNRAAITVMHYFINGYMPFMQIVTIFLGEFCQQLMHILRGHSQDIAKMLQERVAETNNVRKEVRKLKSKTSTPGTTQVARETGASCMVGKPLPESVGDDGSIHRGTTGKEKPPRDVVDSMDVDEVRAAPKGAKLVASSASIPPSSNNYFPSSPPSKARPTGPTKPKRQTSSRIPAVSSSTATATYISPANSIASGNAGDSASAVSMVKGDGTLGSSGSSRNSDKLVSRVMNSTVDCTVVEEEEPLDVHTITAHAMLKCWDAVGERLLASRKTVREVGVDNGRRGARRSSLSAVNGNLSSNGNGARAGAKGRGAGRAGSGGRSRKVREHSMTFSLNKQLLYTVYITI